MANIKYINFSNIEFLDICKYILSKFLDRIDKICLYEALTNIKKEIIFTLEDIKIISKYDNLITYFSDYQTDLIYYNYNIYPYINNNYLIKEIYPFMEGLRGDVKCKYGPKLSNRYKARMYAYGYALSGRSYNFSQSPYKRILNPSHTVNKLAAYTIMGANNLMIKNIIPKTNFLNVFETLFMFSDEYAKILEEIYKDNRSMLRHINDMVRYVNRNRDNPSIFVGSL